MAIDMGNTIKFVVPISKSINAYPNEVRKLNEKPIFKMLIDERYLVLKDSNTHTKIKNQEGNIGWVEKRLIKTIRASSGFIFEKELIESYMETPSPIKINGDIDSYDTLIIEERSFSEDIKVNVDRETIARMR